MELLVEFKRLIELGYSPTEAKSRLSPTYIETVDFPSMVEPCYCPTIGELLSDPQLMLRYNEPLFDKGDEISETDDPWDRDPMQQTAFEDGKPVLTRIAKRSEAQRDKNGMTDSNATGVKGVVPPSDKTVPEGDTSET